MRFALFGSMFPPDRTAKAEEQIYGGVCDAIKRHGGELYLPGNFFQSLPGNIRQKIEPICELAEKLPQVDIVVSVGGDGTFCELPLLLAIQEFRYWVLTPAVSVFWQP